MDYRVIKENDLFLVTDAKGNIPKNHDYGLGLYTKDTRYLSQFDLKINGQEPNLLFSKADENYAASIMLTNPELERDGSLSLPRESLEIERQRFIYGGILYETISVKNYHPRSAEFELSVQIDADFLDMFIIRGLQKAKTGQKLRPTFDNNTFTFRYKGTDGIKRATKIDWGDNGAVVCEDGNIRFRLSLYHLQERTITFRVMPMIDGAEPEPEAREKALDRLQASYKQWRMNAAEIETDHAALRSLVERGIDDFRVLLTDLGYGTFPVAGLPWFGVPFGRDSLIAALQALPFQPEVAKGTLKTMAAFQGTKVDAWRDEQPGKIMHEIRFGELANTNQIPFTPYYGSVDSTPLFLILLIEYVRWTGDLRLFQELRSHVDAALKWIDEYGDRDGDGLVEYHQQSENGISNQGWKDSGDSIVHRNGSYADSPIALAEVQGYVYQAKQGIADIYEKLSDQRAAQSLRRQAAALKRTFEEKFWMNDRGFYAIALDRDKQQVETVTSNPGHLLWSGLLEPDKAKKVAETLVSDNMFSGFGIRTMAEGEAGYNPISYHNGSVWPHDNSLILLGMSKREQRAEAVKVIDGLIRASKSFEYHRLPELFCGYGERVVNYPTACSPQAWAAGTPLSFIQALLGLFPNCLQQEIYLSPVLLPSMNHLHVRKLSIGKGELDVIVKRVNGDVAAVVKRNTTGCRVVIEQQVNV
ncbi:MAG TPA: amylo-alpha-1,6-glucosidase [Bacillales bacterium]|nr:amylo-alpha-1,6-glucosidase [Bacillales bacterium]